MKLSGEPPRNMAAEIMAKALKGEGWSPEKAILSTARRTRETGSHLSRIFGACEMVLEDDLYLAGEAVPAALLGTAPEN